MRKIYFCVLVFFSSCSSIHDENWNIAFNLENSEKQYCEANVKLDCDWRNKQANKYFVVDADFDGDEEIDKAYLATSKNGKGSALIVELSSKHNKPIFLALEKGLLAASHMGIEVVEPSKEKIPTAYAKGYWACGKSEQKFLEIEYPALDYFMYGSANSYFFWNKKLHKFERVWISD